jgi:two-component system sensor histidine kinase KdpD
MLAVAVDRERLAADAVEAEALRRSDAVKTAVLRAVSHDLRSPLTAITTSAEALARFGDALDDADRAGLLDAILVESARLDRLVADLLDLSRLQAGAVEPTRRTCAVDDLVTRALPAGGEGRERVDVVLGATGADVSADAGQIERVLANLVENALKYSPPGARVVVSTSAGGGEASVRVADSGPGLAAGELDRIFEPFERGAAANGVRGAGLGLAIARGLAEANGGRVSARAQDVGACFVLSLPLATTRPAVPVPA